MNNKSRKIFFIINIILFILISIAVVTRLIAPLDDAVSSFIIGIRSDKMTNFFTIMTNIGGAYCLIVITILLAAIMKKKKISLFIAINLVTVFLTSQLAKLIFHRSRPDILSLINETGYSYPSGHTMVSTAYYAFMIYLFLKYFKNKPIKYILIILNITVIPLVAFSRIYLGVHYFSDILAGFTLGFIFLMSYITIIEKLEKR